MNYITNNKVRFYCFYFEGLDKPIVIEAYNKVNARDKLKSIRSTLPDPYKFGKVVGESVKTPLYGITEKEINGVLHVWVGYEFAKNGWIEKNKYDNS